MQKKMSRFTLLTIAVIALVVVALASLVRFAPALFVNGLNGPEYSHLKVGGTSVAYVMMDGRWKIGFRDDHGVLIDYESTGSTAGVKKMIDKDFAVAFTHAPLTDEQRQKAREKGGEVVQIPVALCAVVPIYNVKTLRDKPPLKFTGEVLADIFLGKIEWWDDQPLTLLNEGVELPHTKITVVHREDSSGTTFIFTDYLYEASRSWQEKVGKPKSEIDWPVGVGKDRSRGLADFVHETEGAIGYVDLLQAFHGDIRFYVSEERKLQYGAVQNKDKTEFIHVKAANMTAAAHAVVGELTDDLNFELTNKKGKDSYPLCGVIWAVAYQDQPAARHKQIVDFLHWITHDGQKFTENASFAPLPEEIVEHIDKKLKLISVAK